MTRSTDVRDLRGRLPKINDASHAEGSPLLRGSPTFPERLFAELLACSLFASLRGSCGWSAFYFA